LLDEISEMSLGLQAKLLRVIQEKEVERLGGRTNIQLNARVLATTNRKLREEVAAGRFREDLFYRLNVFPLTLPPLRERPRDILPLAQYLIRKQTAPGCSAPELSGRAQQQMLRHRWAGNVREMDNLIQRAMILRNGETIDAEDLCFEAEGKEEIGREQSKIRGPGGLTDDLRSMEEKMILEVLQEGNGNRKRAAERLGISQRTLRYKIAKLREAGVAIPG
jgi:two-component system response regulator FlrC